MQQDSVDFTKQLNKQEVSSFVCQFMCRNPFDTMGEFSKITAPTVNSREISHFKDLSTEWWDKSGQVHALHLLNELRIPWVIQKLVETDIISRDDARSSKPLQGLTILDVGCGGGFATEALAELGCTVVAIDPCLELIDIAKRRQLQNPTLVNNVTYVHGCMEEHFENNIEKYDAIFASEVLDHVDKPDLFLELCVKCLKPGGSIFITTFNKTWLAWFIIVIIFEYVTGTAPRGTHFYDRFISPGDVENLLKKFNCEMRSLKGFYYNGFVPKWSWTRFTSVSYALHAVKNKM